MPNLPSDDAGRPIDHEQFHRLLLKAEREETALRVERIVPPADNLIAFAVKDGAGRMRGMLALEWGALEMELPDRLLERVQRATAHRQRPNLKLVV